MNKLDVTVQPSGVVLISAHGRLLPQCAVDGRVRPHEIDVDSGVQLPICQSVTQERRRSVTGVRHSQVRERSSLPNALDQNASVFPSTDSLGGDSDGSCVYRSFLLLHENSFCQ